MVPDVPRAYWDANNFIYWLNAAAGYAELLEDCLARSAAGELQIVTSNITIAEVAFSADEREARTLDPSIRSRILDLLLDPRRVELIPFDNTIALDAQSLVRAGMAAGASLKPADAIHLATALHVNVDELQTYDRQLRAAADRLAVIATGEPRWDWP